MMGQIAPGTTLKDRLLGDILEYVPEEDAP